MSTATRHRFIVSNEFPNKRVNIDSLTQEINASSIVTKLDRIDTWGNICDVWFIDALSSGDETTLDGIVTVHQGNASVLTKVKLQEEEVETGGHFSIRSIDMDVAAGQTGIYDVHWPFPVSALSICFHSTTEQCDDIVSLIIGPNSTCGVLTADTGSTAAWVAQNYVVDDIVTFSHPTFGSRIYTCIVDTVSNESPLDSTYWIHGFKLNVSSTVVQFVDKGFYINITDGVNNDDLGRVVDKTDTALFVETQPTNSFLAVTPTYVQMTVIPVPDYRLAAPGRHEIGNTNVTASYVPKDTIVRLTYQNNQGVANKFTGRVQIFY